MVLIKDNYYTLNSIKCFFFTSGLRPPRGMSFKEGDIASSYIRSAITCPGNTCLWPKSVDGFVYVPYIISPVYGMNLQICSNKNAHSSYLFCLIQLSIVLYNRRHGQNHHRNWDARHFLWNMH